MNGAIVASSTAAIVASISGWRPASGVVRFQGSTLSSQRSATNSAELFSVEVEGRFPLTPVS